MLASAFAPHDAYTGSWVGRVQTVMDEDGVPSVLLGRVDVALAVARQLPRQRVHGTALLDGEMVAFGPVQAMAGYFDDSACGEHECCGYGINEPELRVGRVDVLDMLRRRPDGNHRLVIDVEGYAPPLVEVQYAHHATSPLPAMPGEVKSMGLDVACRAVGALTADSRREVERRARAERDRLAGVVSPRH